MESPTHTFRDTSLVLQLIYEPRIKNKTGIIWSLRKKKCAFFVMFILPEEISFNICVLSEFLVY